MQHTILDVPGLKIGHAQHNTQPTGCTVILCVEDTIGAVSLRGANPTAQEAESHRRLNQSGNVHGILLTGRGEAGFADVVGVRRFLSESYSIDQPVVGGASIDDISFAGELSSGTDLGHTACQHATDSTPQGNVGAGLGATIGKYLGPQRMMKGGLGTASMQIIPGLFIGALVVVNTVGSITDPTTGQMVAGTRSAEYNQPKDSLYLLKRHAGQGLSQTAGESGVIGVLATNAKMTLAQAQEFARMGQDGIAWAVRPSHSLLDKDVVFGLSTGKVDADFNLVSAFAAEVVSDAIVNAVKYAKRLKNVPGYAGV